MAASAVAAVLMVLFAVGLLLAPHSADRLRRKVSEVGAWAPLAMVAIYALLTCAFVPGSALAGASGLLLEAALGTGLAVVPATHGPCPAFRGPSAARAGDVAQPGDVIEAPSRGGSSSPPPDSWWLRSLPGSSASPPRRS